MIPRLIHLVFGMRADFGGKPWSLVHHLAVKSAAEVNGIRPTVWVCWEPTGPWWERTREIADVRPIDSFEWRGPNRFENQANRADLARLEILLEHGGVYLDCDTLSVRPLAELLDGPAVIGMEHGDTLCNGVILAPPGDPFLVDWIALFGDPKSPYVGSYAGLACRARATSGTAASTTSGSSRPGGSTTRAGTSPTCSSTRPTWNSPTRSATTSGNRSPGTAGSKASPPSRSAGAAARSTGWP